MSLDDTLARVARQEFARDLVAKSAPKEAMADQRGWPNATTAVSQ